MPLGYKIRTICAVMGDREFFFIVGLSGSDRNREKFYLVGTIWVPWVSEGRLKHDMNTQRLEVLSSKGDFHFQPTP